MNGPVATRQTTYVDDVAAADSGTFLEAVGAACIALESFPLAYARPSYAVVPSVSSLFILTAPPPTHANVITSSRGAGR